MKGSAEYAYWAAAGMMSKRINAKSTVPKHFFTVTLNGSRHNSDSALAMAYRNMIDAVCSMMLCCDFDMVADSSDESSAYYVDEEFKYGLGSFRVVFEIADSLEGDAQYSVSGYDAHLDSLFDVAVAIRNKCIYSKCESYSSFEAM